MQLSSLVFTFHVIVKVFFINASVTDVTRNLFKLEVNILNMFYQASPRDKFLVALHACNISHLNVYAFFVFIHHLFC